MEEITKDMKIGDILALNELIAPFLMQNGLGCVSCSASSAESLEEACELHGINVEDLTEDLNDVLREYLETQDLPGCFFSSGDCYFGIALGYKPKISGFSMGEIY